MFAFLASLLILTSPQVWILEWEVNGVKFSQSYRNYDTCNTQARFLDSTGIYVSRWCIDSWDLN